jgi:hypothetical protein
MLTLLTIAAFAADPDDLPEAAPPAPAPREPESEPNEGEPAGTPAAPPAPAEKKPVTQAQIQAAVDAAYGKPVPAPAVCVARPDLAGRVPTEVVAFGVTQRYAGCKLLGVMVDAAPVATADALPAALAGGWAKLDAKARTELVAAWTTQVLLAFDHVAPGTTATVKPLSGSKLLASVPFTAKLAEAHVSQDVAGAFTFDPSGKLTATSRDQGPTFTTALYQTMYSVQGTSEGVIAAGIKSIGGEIQQCVDERFAADPTIAAVTRFAWTLDGTGQIGKLGAEESADAELTRCYGNALYNATWTVGQKGAAVWSFAVVRNPR